MYQDELFVVVLSRKYKRLRIRKYFDELSNKRGKYATCTIIWLSVYTFSIN